MSQSHLPPEESRLSSEAPPQEGPGSRRIFGHCHSEFER